MSTPLEFGFRWLSPLGASAVLFLAWGVLLLFVGVLGPILVARYGPGSSNPSMMDYFFFSVRADTVYFAGAPLDLVKETPAIARLHTLMASHMSGLFIAFAVCQIGLAWFGLRQGHTWALWVLAIGGLAFIVHYWAVQVIPVYRVVPLRLSDLHPYALYPTLFVPIATLLGWIGLR